MGTLKRIRELEELAREMGWTDVSTTYTGSTHLKVAGRINGRKVSIITGMTPSSDHKYSHERQQMRRLVREHA